MKKILISLVVLALIGGAYAYYQFNRGQESMDSVKSELSTSAAEIYQAFGNDETTANTKYLGKTMTVKGKVSSTTTEEGVVSVTLFADSETGGVICKLDPLTQHAKTNFAEGEEVSFKGICTGYLMDVVLERCVVEK